MCVCENFGTSYHLIGKLVSELGSVEMNIVNVKFDCEFAVSLKQVACIYEVLFDGGPPHLFTQENFNNFSSGTPYCNIYIKL